VRSRDGRVAALAGAAIALVTVPVLPAGAPIVVSSLGAGVALLARSRRRRADDGPTGADER
jgi:hypothetical protein